MIRVDRSRLGCPPVLTSKRAISERTRAEAFFAPPKKGSSGKASGKKKSSKAASSLKGSKKPAAKASTKFEFKVYKLDEVRAALHQLFKGKCAYCETRYVAIQPMDVEHFRPKSEVTDFDGLKQDGYYWLAAEWTNLLPSCIDCNRPRHHRENAGGPQLLLGKNTLFPIAPDSRRARFGESLDVERPLLLDPCRDPTEAYIAFAEAVVRPSKGKGAAADAAPRVAASVRVYGLNRVDLVQERRQVLLNLRRRFHQLRTLMLTLNTARRMRRTPRRDVVVRSLEDLISHEADTIMRMGRPDEPYSLMVTQEIKAFEREIGEGLLP